MTKLNKRIVFYLAIGIAVLFVGIVIATYQDGNSQSPAQLLSLGEQYLSELDYDQAVVQFLKVIEIDPMNERAYLGAAEAYWGMGQADKALEILRLGLEQTDSEQIRAMIETLESTGNSEDQNNTTPLLRESDSSTTENTDRSLWSEDEWVIEGISVIHGSIYDFAEVFGAEVMGPHPIIEGVTGWSFVIAPADVGLTNVPLVVNATQYESSNQLVQINVKKPGAIGPRGIVIGATTYAEVISTLPDFNGTIEYDEEGFAYSRVFDQEEKSSVDAMFDRNNTVYPNPPDVPYRLQFSRTINNQHHMYFVDFENGIVRSLDFEIFHEDR